MTTRYCDERDREISCAKLPDRQLFLNRAITQISCAKLLDRQLFSDREISCSKLPDWQLF